MVSAAKSKDRIAQVSGHFESQSSDPQVKSMQTQSGNQSQQEVLLERRSDVWRVLLNRPKSLNALNTNMIKLLKTYLQEAEASTECKVVLLEGEGRAFCAGGDVITVTKEAAEKSPHAADFFKEEYELDNFISKMKTPLISLMDGVTMGGGVGLSVHAPFRIATDNTIFAMPETTIGLFPDVGASFFLSRLDGELGTYLALTSERLLGPAVFQAGIASHFVPASRISSFRDRLSEVSGSLSHDQINALIEEHSEDPEPSKEASALHHAKILDGIESCFSADTVEGIIAKLQEAAGGSELRDWATGTLEKIMLRSPTSLKVTLRELRHGRALNIDEAFEMEFGIAQQFCDASKNPDFIAGVKHLLIEKKKGRAPWNPATVEEVKDTDIEKQFFSHLPQRLQSSTQRLNFLATSPPFIQYPHRLYSLPTAEDVRYIVTGEHPSSGSFALHTQDIVRIAMRDRKGKIGVERATRRILGRKCKVTSENLLTWRRTRDAKQK